MKPTCSLKLFKTPDPEGFFDSEIFKKPGTRPSLLLKLFKHSTTEVITKIK